MLLENISIHHKGGVTEEQISEKWKEEREKNYPEGTSWRTLPSKGFFIRHARNITFSNVKITTEAPDVRPDFIEIDAIDIVKR